MLLEQLELTKLSGGWPLPDGSVFWVSQTRHVCSTTLPNGFIIYGEPHETDEYVTRARELGYSWHSNPAWAMCVEHEFYHSLLGLRPDGGSQVFYDMAAGIPPTAIHYEEERIVLDFQKKLNLIRSGLNVAA